MSFKNEAFSIKTKIKKIKSFRERSSERKNRLKHRIQRNK